MKQILIILQILFSSVALGQYVIYGNVYYKDVEGVPINGAKVELIRGDSTVQQTQTDTSGGYEFSFSEAANYQVKWSYCTYGQIGKVDSSIFIEPLRIKMTTAISCLIEDTFIGLAYFDCNSSELIRVRMFDKSKDRKKRSVLATLTVDNNDKLNQCKVQSAIRKSLKPYVRVSKVKVWKSRSIPKRMGDNPNCMNVFELYIPLYEE